MLEFLIFCAVVSIVWRFITAPQRSADSLERIEKELKSKSGR